MFCSMYSKVMPLNNARFGSAWKKQAEMPIFNMRGMRRRARTLSIRSSHCLGENPLEVRARAFARVGLVAGVVDRNLDQRRNVGLGYRPLGRVSGQRGGNAEVALQCGQPVDEGFGTRFRRRAWRSGADDVRELGHFRGGAVEVEAH